MDTGKPEERAKFIVVTGSSHLKYGVFQDQTSPYHVSYPPYRVQPNFIHLVYVIGPPLCLNKKVVIARGG